MKLIDKDALVAEIERLKSIQLSIFSKGESIGHCYDSLTCISVYNEILSFLDTIEVKEVELMIYTIIAECCDWLAAYTELSHEEIEGCRNLMLTVKDEQLKAQKGEKI